MPSSSFVFGGFPLSSRFVVKFPTPFQAFPSSPFEFISGSLFVRFVLSPRFVFCFSPFPLCSFSQPPSCVGVEPLFIEPKEWGSLLSRIGQGSAGRLASGRRWQGMLPLISHHQGAWGFRSFAGHATRWK